MARQRALSSMPWAAAVLGCEEFGSLSFQLSLILYIDKVSESIADL